MRVLMMILVTLGILTISEIIPKTIGATYWQALANFTTKTLEILIFPFEVHFES